MDKAFDQEVKSDIRTYDNIRKLQLVKEMIAKLAFTRLSLFKRSL